jgi:hypothetical protein
LQKASRRLDSTSRAAQLIDGANVPITKQVQGVCHDILPGIISFSLDDMLRLRIVALTSMAAAVLVFCGYSIPVYFQLVAHQPDKDPPHVTSFPPGYAFLVGACLAVLTLIGVLLIFAVIWVFSRHRNSRVLKG